jgi:ABC-type nickel/cobalt efflux system permease component RcnA
MKHTVRTLKIIALVSQGVFAIAVPIVLCVVGGKWLTTRLGAGRWLMALCILLGVATAIWSLWKLIAPFVKEEKTGDAPASFHEHQ